MAENDDQDKTEEPTPRRLEKAREDGQIARSRELSTFVMLVVGVAAFWISGSYLSEHLALVMTEGMRFDHALLFDIPAMGRHCGQIAMMAVLAVAPLMLALTVAALLAPMLLGGWLFSSKSLAPSFGKLNPIKGAKKLISAHSFSELGKALAKTLIIGGVAALFIAQHSRELLSLSETSAAGAIAEALSMIMKSILFMLLAFLFVVGIDVPFQLHSHKKKLRMTKQEIKREHKDSEGDPHIKGKIRQQQQAMARRRMMAEVPEANVIVTNPTHYAAALKYQEGMAAPILVAKGSDEVAKRIREMGREHGIPLLEAPPLARSLCHYCDLEQEIPPGLYAAVAEVLAWVYRLDLAQRQGEALPDEPHDFDIPDELVDPQTRDQDTPISHRS